MGFSRRMKPDPDVPAAFRLQAVEVHLAPDASRSSSGITYSGWVLASSREVPRRFRWHHPYPVAPSSAQPANERGEVR